MLPDAIAAATNVSDTQHPSIRLNQLQNAVSGLCVENKTRFQIRITQIRPGYNYKLPGIRPGRPTSDYLQKKCSRLTMFGALFLMIIAIIPTLLLKVLNITVLSAFGPTSILIMISVSIEIADQLDSLMIMRNHKGFLN